MSPLLVKCLFILSCVVYLVEAVSLNVPINTQRSSRPLDFSNVQLDHKQKFIGNILWGAVDVLTFGALESNNNKKKNTTANSTSNATANATVTTNKSTNATQAAPEPKKEKNPDLDDIMERIRSEQRMIEAERKEH